MDQKVTTADKTLNTIPDRKNRFIPTLHMHMRFEIKIKTNTSAFSSIPVGTDGQGI